MKRLSKSQKEKLLAWISEGLETDEINERAADFTPPFAVSRQQVDYYRQSREVKLKEIRDGDEEDALRTGYALRVNRVRSLERLARLIEEDLFSGLLWIDDVKSVGQPSVIVDFQRFHEAGVRQWRGLLDDIAREMGERRAVEQPGDLPDFSQLTDDQLRAIVTGKGRRRA